ncbi:MAG: helix-turn-helix transcriptional regulator [Clostridia bacterium]|nr:helix-turn-helix transcriptional regulator [Clostridia bacterium]MBR0509673.1 helix-turn-helix transcriptional regulator [Clostridia bacterium]MBR5424542.1 helix-turn-helix transcriptional regulator [Clostridia bacterium]
MSVEEKKLAKKLRLLDAAYELFGSKGVNLTAIDEVVRLAGVAKGTFYLYFKDKYDLLDQMILIKSERIFAAAMETAQQKREAFSLSAADTTVSFTEELLRSLSVDRALVSLLQRNLPSFQALVLAGENGVLKAPAERLVELFETCAETREDAKKMLYIYISLLGSVCCDSILTGAPYSVEALKPQLFSVIRHMFSKEPTEP